MNNYAITKIRLKKNVKDAVLTCKTLAYRYCAFKINEFVQFDGQIFVKWVSEWDWLLNVTYNDISVIYVTAHRCADGLKKKFDLRSRSQRHRHFVPSKYRHEANLRGTARFQSPFTTHMETRRAYYSVIHPRAPKGGILRQEKRGIHPFYFYSRMWSEVRATLRC